jgi:hypothetical protein
MALEILAVALIPSTLPTWRGTFIAAGTMYLLLLLAFFLLLRQLDSITSSGGPAFFAIALLHGVSMAILVGSCLSKLIIASVLSRMQSAPALWLRRVLIGSGLFVAAALACAFFLALVTRGFATFVGATAIWLSLVTWLLPESSSSRNRFTDRSDSRLGQGR